LKYHILCSLSFSKKKSITGIQFVRIHFGSVLFIKFLISDLQRFKNSKENVEKYTLELFLLLLLFILFYFFGLNVPIKMYNLQINTE